MRRKRVSPRANDWVVHTGLCRRESFGSEDLWLTAREYVFSGHYNRLVVANCLETEVAFWAAPNVMDVRLTPVFRTFGSDQLIAALRAFYPKTGARVED